ncbi:acyltransferase family protein [Pseudoclavibacter sp. JSM 162008]|uniref:acyltransferase family protein n=1 Tax=Pseudoclavibacter sp. JSM 162008 TaxID=3229855 RepID=UPI003523C38B
MNSSLRSALSNRDNALNFVRLILAASVILGHAWAIGGFGETPLGFISGWAVNGFFGISGYLIAGSRMRLAFAAFVTNRALRIFPAFWCVLLVTAFLLAPLSTLLSGETYSITSALNYVVRNAGLYIFQWGIDDTLMNVPFSVAWNGSLWTLFYEFVAYLAAALLLTLAVVRKHALAATAVATACAIVAQILALTVLDVSTNLFLNFLRLGGFFAAGMLIYFLGERIRLELWPAVLAAIIFVALMLFGVAETLAQIPFTYVLLWIGARARIRIGSKNDISYGIYIWGCPVQQLLALSGTAWMGPWLSALVAFVLTVPLAWASWKFVEEPAMRLRNLLPNSWHGAARQPTRQPQE